MVNRKRQENRKPKMVNGPGGFITLITVMIVGVIITTTAAFLLITGTSSSKYSQAVAGGNGAKAAVEACAELALASIQANPNLATPSSGNSTIDSASNTSCSYTITGTNPNLTITANGTVDQNSNYVRKLTITTSQLVPKIVISSWQDSP